MTPESLALLHRMWQHPRAPLYNFRCGDGLDAFGVAYLRHYAESLRNQPARAGRPVWLDEFVEQCLQAVPHYRNYPRDQPFESLPTLSRHDLKQPERLIPEGQPLDALTVVTTSGTSGNRLRLCTHALDVASPWILMEHALQNLGVLLQRGPQGGVALANLTFHRDNLIFANISHAFEGAGFMKLNLHPSYWRQGADRAAYLDAFQPQVLAGDPLSLAELLQLDLQSRPRAIFSSGMQLLEGVRSRLQQRFQCPVLDVYSLTECRYLACSEGHGHRILPNDVYVEILDEAGRPVPAGERGIVTLTGGRNPYMPLLRYRTGDVAALEVGPHGEPRLSTLEGRSAVAFLDIHGRRFNNIEVTKCLREFPLFQFSLHQRADRSLLFEYLGEAEEEQLRASLEGLFGSLPLDLQSRSQEEQTGRKWILYSSELT